MSFEQIPLKQGLMYHIPDFIGKSASFDFIQQLKQEIKWKQETLRFFGKSLLTPRLTAWYGDEGMSYSYSGLKLSPNIWTPALLEIKNMTEFATNCRFNSVLLNWYRNGNDSMGWHSDDEKELGLNPVIASVSLGAERIFRVREKLNHKNSFGIKLNNGSLLLMAGELQHYWQHCLPRSAKSQGDRINLTFRMIVA